MIEKYQRKYRVFRQCEHQIQRAIVTDMIEVMLDQGPYFQNLLDYVDSPDVSSDDLFIIYEGFLKAIVESAQEQESVAISNLNALSEHLLRIRQQEEREALDEQENTDTLISSYL